MVKRDIIVVGASTRGVDALARLAAGLPAGFPASVFVVCHFPPGERSVLLEILSRAGQLLAEHTVNDAPFLPGHIYVAPPDWHLTGTCQLAARVGHEIRNPLTSIKMLVQAAIEEPMRAALTDQDMRIIEQEVRMIEATLQTFLDFARPVGTERELVDLKEVLVAVSGLLRRRAEEQNATVRVDTPSGPITVLAYPGQFRQVFMNLTLKALDAIPGGGTLLIRARRDGTGRVEVKVANTRLVAIQLTLLPDVRNQHLIRMH
jgi:hypothetical protein